jgi:hypothetical protein
MSYYIVKVYGLVCDNCEASEEHVPNVDDPGKLVATRRALSKPPSNWTRRDGQDLCGKCSAVSRERRSV